MAKNVKPLTLFIRADAFRSIGTGHVMRCMALANAWKIYGGKVIFVSHCDSEDLRNRITNEGLHFVDIHKPHPHFSDLENTSSLLDNISTTEDRSRTIVVLDGYHFDSYYQKTIKQKGFRLLCVDDYGHAGQYFADVILNQNLSADMGIYQNCTPHTKFLLGPRYALLRSEFMSWKTWKRDIPRVAKKVLVTMGGADNDNVTLKIIQALQDIKISDLEVIVLLGSANIYKREIEHALGDASFVNHLLQSVDNMPEIMAWADIAIAAGGSTSLELSFMGLPSLLLVLAENQRLVSEKFDAVGVSKNLGWFDKAKLNTISYEVQCIMKDQSARESMSNKGRSLVDGKGCFEVVKVLTDTHLTFRQANKGDCRLVWEWANDPETRSVSFSSNPIAWEHHTKWFDERLKDSNHVFFILSRLGDEPVGQVRYAINDKEAVISMSISPEFHGQGYGAEGIRLTVKDLFRHKDINVVRAHIKTENLKSIKTFTKAGFRSDSSIENRLPANNSLTFSIHRDDIYDESISNS